MATNMRNLSTIEKDIPSAAGLRFGILVSEWNSEITDKLLEGALETLLKQEVSEDDIFIKNVPGSFELSIGAQFMAEYTEVDAVICLGCVIQGETPHFEYICQAIAQGLTNVSLEYNIPVIFGVLTTSDELQAKERSGGKHGNKGTEAAITALKMALLQDEMMEEDESDEDDE